MKKIALLFSFLLSLSVLQAQNEYAEYIVKDANVAAQAMIQKDVDKMIGYMPDNIVEMGGGLKFMKEQVQANLKMFADQKITIKDVITGDPGDLVIAGDEIHCVIPQTLKMNLGEHDFDQHRNILAVSNDEGANWRFLDLSQYDTKSLKLFFPEFNDKLVIPELKEY